MTATAATPYRLDPRRLLAHASLYEAFQRTVGKNKLRRLFVERYVRPTPGMTLLDVGCGPGDLIPHLPTDIEYVGCDVSAPYIEAAEQRLGDRGTFHLGGIDRVPLEPASVDRIVTVGVLHHVPDDVATTIVETAKRLLRPGGRFVALEPHMYPGMHPVSRALISRDRGEYVRLEHEYVALCEQALKVTVTREEDFLRVPYSLAILDCSVD